MFPVNALNVMRWQVSTREISAQVSAMHRKPVPASSRPDFSEELLGCDKVYCPWA
jgi:hypothetical protein